MSSQSQSFRSVYARTFSAVILAIGSLGSLQPATAEASASTDEAEVEPQLSLSLQRVPLTEMLSLLEKQFNLKFRYALPPSALVSTQFNNAPLYTSLQELLHSEGYRLWRDGRNLFLLGRSEEGRENALWQRWQGDTLPSRLYLSLQGSDFAARGWEDRWQPCALTIQPRLTPAVTLIPPERKPEAEVQTQWLRCLLTLQEVPKGTQLWLESAPQARLWVNGVSLGQSRERRRVVQVAPLLRRGLNVLALQVPVDDAQVRFEWLMASS